VDPGEEEGRRKNQESRVKSQDGSVRLKIRIEIGLNIISGKPI